ncbi:ankyrin repeat protein [Zymoseptoria brevis]|uniref:Ankyrin repeat protein n=1 Tax=Zymoseptoria brevis TaxID=1047168 RepID=A0A0F4GMD3_9PEZI|nr:ankyrin repeat protein [Zymoseptoria brevis]
MEVVGSAVGIASLGIQVCQGLLDYYDGWKGYPTDIAGAYNSIADLNKTLALLKVSLDAKELDHDRAERAKEALETCKDGLTRLSKKLQKLQTHEKPQGFRQRLWSEFQRGSYPFKASTLAKLREIVDDVMERLKPALQVLQLDVSINSQKTLLVVAADTKETAKRTAFIESAVTDISTQTQQLLASKQSDQFKKITHWLSPPDPLTNHFSARQRHEPHTGAWLLDHKSYLNWKTGTIKHLWMYGKAGCGKTVLSSTTIEDMQRHCGKLPNVGHAIFYFSFSDDHKQSYENMIGSVTAQLAWKDPGLSMLQQAYEKPTATRPSIEELENIVVKSIQSYDTVYLQLDALDECPESNDIRQHVLDGLKRLSQRAPSLGIFATSRELRDVHEAMDQLGAELLVIPTRAVDIDIQRYVMTTVSHDPRLGRLSPETKLLIQATIAQKADGMFRWAYCQLQELKKLKSTKPKYVKDALLSLPSNLDETYERMLTGIEERYREEALTLLRWITYARSPLTLGELAEVTIVNPEGTGSVDFDERGDIEDTLDILTGLVTVTGHDESVHYDRIATALVHKGTKIRLAHFTVQEYLESKRIIDSKARNFYLEYSACHRFLAHSCLTYMEHYSASDQRDKRNFPVLSYARNFWVHHSSVQQSEDVSREVRFLCSEKCSKDWLRTVKGGRTTSALYLASFYGFDHVVSALLRNEAITNPREGRLYQALSGASLRGNDKVVRILIDAGAVVDAKEEEQLNALEAAAMEGHEKIVRMLIDAGANVNAIGADGGSALPKASFVGHEVVVRMLLDAGANATHALTPDQGSANALHEACDGGHTKIVQMLLDAGADINGQGGRYGSPLQAASNSGHAKTVQVLLDAGAKVNAQGREGCAIHSASYEGHASVVQILLEAGADPDALDRWEGIARAPDGWFTTALEAAARWGHEDVVRVLIDAGADVNIRFEGTKYRSALEAAEGNETIKRMLIDAGAVQESDQLDD